MTIEGKADQLSFQLQQGAEGGYLDVRSIDAQVEVLNREFASTGIQFVRQTYQYWRNKEWFEGVDLDPR